MKYTIRIFLAVFALLLVTLKTATMIYMAAVSGIVFTILFIAAQAAGITFLINEYRKGVLFK